MPKRILIIESGTVPSSPEALAMPPLGTILRVAGHQVTYVMSHTEGASHLLSTHFDLVVTNWGREESNAAVLVQRAQAHCPVGVILPPVVLLVPDVAAWCRDNEGLNKLFVLVTPFWGGGSFTSALASVGINL